MTFRPFPETTITTSFGKLTFWSTGPNHVGVRTSGNVNVHQPEDGPDAAILVNRVPFHFRADLHTADWSDWVEKGMPRWVKEIGHGWFVDPTSSTGISMSKLIAQPDGTFSSAWPGEASEAARRKVVEKLLPEVVAFLQTAEGQAILGTATSNKLATAVEAAEVRIAKLEAELEQAHADHRAALAAWAEDGVPA